MTDVFVERQPDVPLTDGDMRQIAADSWNCLGIHRVAWHGSMLSTDGRRLVCHFSGADAESVRMALRQAGSGGGTAWAGSVIEPPGLSDEERDAANVLVSRRFDQPTPFEAVQAIEDRGKTCLETHRVRFVRTFFSNDRRRMICLYSAPDAESVRIAQREAKMPVEQVWAFRAFRP